MSDEVKTVTLPNSRCMPMVGLGTWQSKGKVCPAVEHAIDIGYRHVDGAQLYGVDDEIGEAVENKIKEGKVKREDMFITSKLWCTFHHPNDVRPAFMKTLKSLRTEYIDLFLMEAPFGYVNNGELFPRDENGKMMFSDVDYVDTWKVLEKIHEEGLAKSIGVSNFNEYQINRILKECSIKPANNQIESHPYLANEDMVNFCKSKGISVTAFAPLGSAKRPWKKNEEPVVLEDPKIKEIAKRIGKTPAQVALRHQVQRGVAVIPKSVTPSRIEENFKIFDFSLSDDDMTAIKELNRNLRGFAYEWDSDHKYWPHRPNYSE